MSKLTGLPDTKGDKDCRIVCSVSAVISTLRAGVAATAAGDNGAINAWKDDNGKWRGAFFRYCCLHGDINTSSLAALRRWLVEWWPRLGREEA